MKKVGKNLLSLLQGQKPEHFCDPSPVRSNVQNYYYSQNQKKTDSLKTELQNLNRDDFMAVSDLVDKIVFDLSDLLIDVGDEIMLAAAKDYMIDLINPELLDFDNDQS